MIGGIVAGFGTPAIQYLFVYLRPEQIITTLKPKRDMNQSLPPVTKNLLIINVLVYLGTLVATRYGIWLEGMLGLHFVWSPYFKIYQLLTYMFVHAGFWHLFFNMFSLWMFGRIIEMAWGSQRFLLFYMVCGIGAGLSQEVFQFVQLYSGFLGALAPTVGASGAIYGILLAFGMTFPNERIMLLIPPIPMKAKYFVFLFAAIELFSALSDSGGNVAHCAHLGGMLFGWLLILYWRRNNRRRNGGGFNGWDEWAGRKESWRDRFRKRFTAAARQHVGRKTQSRRQADILEKIKRSGYESLTEEEKRDLFRNSQS